MKVLLIVLFLFGISNLSFCQNWDAQHEKILAEYNLSKTDHRGLLFVSKENDSHEIFNNLSDAIEYYLGDKDRLTDIIKVYVQKYPEEHLVEGTTLGVFEVVELKIALESKK